MAVDTFWTRARTAPDVVAVTAPDGTPTTAGELASRSHQLVHALRARGLRPGDTLAYCLPNGVEVLELVLACLQAGWYVVPVNWHLTGPEIAYLLRDSGARVFVAHERAAPAAAQAAREVQAGADTDAGVEAGAEATCLTADNCFAVGTVDGFRPYSDLTDSVPSTAPDERTQGAILSYTSGTTGRPKGVQRPLPGDAPEDASAVGFVLRLFGVEAGPHHVHLVGCPLYHAQPINFALASLHLGHRIVLMDRWTPHGMLEHVEQYGVTIAPVVPTQFVRLLALPREERERYRTSSLTHVIHAAAPCPADVKRRMLDWWGPVVHEQYSASEGGGTVVLGHEWLARPGTVGRPWPGSRVAVLDDDGRPVPAGEVGTVYMHMPGRGFGYRHDPEKTRDNRVGDMFTVGDMGYLDDDGWLFLCDRRSDVIISGGVNIYPAEIENALVTHPDVVDVAVFGIPDDDWGEQVKAVVQPAPRARPGDDLTAALLDWCAGRLARYKLPRSVDYVEQLPRDPNGKLYKRRLRDPYWRGRDRT